MTVIKTKKKPTNEEIIECLKEGLTFQETADMFDTPLSTISTRILKLQNDGLIERRTTKNFKPITELDGQIIQDYNDGLKYREIADRYELTPSQINSIIHRLIRHEKVIPRNSKKHEGNNNPKQEEKEVESVKKEGGNELMNLLSDMSDMEAKGDSAGISVRHKEMLIEVLHRILI